MTRRDVALYSRKHRDHNRAHWQQLRLPCARCRRPIDYFGPEFFADGRLNPRYLVVGHIVSRTEGAERGWTLSQINDVTNTQPECKECSLRSGGEESVMVRRGLRAAAQRPNRAPADRSDGPPRWGWDAPEGAHV
jgi:hypothetical protein